jgi:hypothetical protein
MAENLPSPEEIARLAAEEAETEAKRLIEERLQKAREAEEQLKALREKLKNIKLPKFPPLPKFEPKKLPNDRIKKFNKNKLSGIPSVP